MRALGESHPNASFSSCLSSAHFQNCFLHCLLRLRNGCRACSRPCSPGHRAILCAWLVRGAAFVKLVHCSIEQARPACSSWPLLPAASIRFEHEPVGAEERPSTEPAVARCLLHHAMVHERDRTQGEIPHYQASNCPPTQRVSRALVAVMRPRQREIQMQRSSYSDISPPLNTRVFTRPNGSSQAYHCPRL